MSKNYTDLFTVLDHRLAEDKRFCSRVYWEWENEVAKPALLELGYTDVRFAMGERDSFGPLSRLVHAVKDGESITFIYG